MAGNSTGPQAALQRALHHLETGAPERCLNVCEEILADSPGLIQALYLRGCAALATGDIARAVTDLEVVHGNHPEHLHAAFNLGRSLVAAGRFEEALAPLQTAFNDLDLALPVRYQLAICFTRLRRRTDAIEQYEAILSVQPDNTQVAANLASLLERENRLDEAGHWASQVLAADPGNELARVTSATLARRGENYPEAIAQLRALIPDIQNPVNRSIALNQLGQCLESRQDWDEAFEAFSEANRILLNHHPAATPDPRGPHGLKTLARIRDWLAERPMERWNEAPTDQAGGIAFLVGFPRSGTTLLDTMLGAHPDLEVLEEKSLFAHLHQDWSNPGTLEALVDVTDAQIIDAREIYRREMSRHRRLPDRSMVIDKLPLNLAYLFLIYRLFPEAPVIFLLRHPMDACTSCYFQAFELEGAMANFLDIERTANFYDAMMQVASPSLEQIGNPVHTMRYEDLVTAPVEQLAQLFEFLDLEKPDPMPDYRQSTRDAISNTPSYQQVSQPLYQRSIGRWRHYAEPLESLRPVLEPWARRFGYDE
jgi:tetratricopeptide (TPR) repeat protein